MLRDECTLQAEGRAARVCVWLRCPYGVAGVGQPLRPLCDGTPERRARVAAAEGASRPAAVWLWLREAGRHLPLQQGLGDVPARPRPPQGSHGGVEGEDEEERAGAGGEHHRPREPLLARGHSSRHSPQPSERTETQWLSRHRGSRPSARRQPVRPLRRDHSSRLPPHRWRPREQRRRQPRNPVPP